MGNVVSNISMSTDGFIAGPNPSLDEPLGEGGEQLHEWGVRLASWREPHGKSGGDTGPDNDVMEEAFKSGGATVMGRKMFSGGEGPWEDDPKADGWWGDEPPFGHPVFILTHHPREAVTKQGGTTFNFVTEGVEAALDQAREAAGDKDVSVGGGASAIQQALNAGLLDEIQIHVIPVLLGGGTRLFGDEAGGSVELEKIRVIDSPDVTHLKFRVAK
jgi:dihydrofolate reductase